MASIINGESSPGYYVTPTGITIGGRTKEYATIPDMLADTNPGKFARVADATGDTTVKSGAAIYRREGTDWVKVYEEESMDIETKITWDTLSGAPEVTAEQVEAAVDEAHSHTNGTVLAKIGVDTNGNLTIDGNVVGGNADIALSRLNVVEPIVSGLQNTVDAHATSIGALETDKHNHSNKSVLDQLSVSNGQLQLNGVNVDSTADLSDYATKTDVSNAVDAISIPSDVADLTDNQGLLGVSSWSAITGKPDTFTPAAHTHTVSDITNLSIPGDLSELADTNGILSGKQDKITGTTGQFVTIGSNGTPIAETIDLENFGSVKTVNGISPDSQGNVTITQDMTAYYTKNEIDLRVSSIQSSVDINSGIISSQLVSISNLEKESHTHTNKSVLDRLSVNNNKLQLDGIDVDTNTITDLTNYATKTDVDTAIGSITIPSDLSDLTDNTNILAGKQSVITGTAGQFIKIGSNGTPTAESVDLSIYAKTVNGVSPDANGNIEITVGSGDVTSEQLEQLAVVVENNTSDIATIRGMSSNNLASISNLDDRISVVENTAHTHTIKVKTFDPGIAGTITPDIGTIFDFNTTTRLKITNTSDTASIIPRNFVDGAEAYVIIYGGVTVSWSAFGPNGNVDESEDANHFDGIVWKDNTEPRSVGAMSTGFQMVKLMVVDNTVVGELVVDTCN